MRVSTPTAMLLVLCACGGQATEPSSPLVLTLDQSAYLALPQTGSTIQWRFTVIATTRNPGTAAVQIPLCAGTPFYGFGVAGGGGYSAYDPIYGCEPQTTQAVLPAGAARVDTIVVSGPKAINGSTGAFDGVLEGSFVFGIASERGFVSASPVRVTLSVK